MIPKLTFVLVVSVLYVFAQQPPFSGTIFNFPKSFRDSDPTALTKVTFKAQQSKTVYDRRANGMVTINAYVYTATFNDGCPAWEMIVNPEFNQTQATTLAEKYAHNIGQMPICVRTGITGAVIHDGNNPWGGGSPLIIHHGQGLSYERDSITTETMIHEATHGAFDRKYYTPAWKAAATADGNYISTYARDNPNSEDHSETFLCWLAACYKKERINATDFTKITTTVPKRLKFYDSLKLNLSPMVATNVVFNDNPSKSTPFTLLTNGLNTFHSKITLVYTIEKSSQVTLQIFDMKGCVVRTLVKEMAVPGRYKKVWDANNNADQRVPSGTYFCTLIAGEFQITQKVVVLP